MLAGVLPEESQHVSHLLLFSGYLLAGPLAPPDP